MNPFEHLGFVWTSCSWLILVQVPPLYLICENFWWPPKFPAMATASSSNKMEQLPPPWELLQVQLAIDQAIDQVNWDWSNSTCLSGSLHCSLSPLPILLGAAMQMIPPQIPTARPTGRLGATHLDVPCLPQTSWSLLPQCHTRHTQLPSVTNVENWEYTEMWHSVLGSPLYHKTIGTPYTAASPTSVDRPRSTSHTTGPNTSRIHPRNTIYGATFGSQLVGTRTSPPTTAPAKQHSKRPTSQSWPPWPTPIAGFGAQDSAWGLHLNRHHRDLSASKRLWISRCLSHHHAMQRTSQPTIRSWIMGWPRRLLPRGSAIASPWIFASRQVPIGLHLLHSICSSPRPCRTSSQIRPPSM